MEQELQELIEKCLAELSLASSNDYDINKADKTAALCLMTQIKLISFLETVEFSARQSKNDIARIEAEKYNDLKMAPSDKKLTEVALTHSLASEEEVQKAKLNHAQCEASLKKWNYLVSSLKDSYYYFKSIAKQKNPSNFGD